MSTTSIPRNPYQLPSKKTHEVIRPLDKVPTGRVTDLIISLVGTTQIACTKLKGVCEAMIEVRVSGPRIIGICKSVSSYVKIRKWFWPDMFVH